MKRLLHSFILVFFIMAEVRCDYLDMVPEKDIQTIETIFEKREDAETWLKTCYSAYRYNFGTVTFDPSFLGTDELVTGQYARRVAQGQNFYSGVFIADGRQMSQTPYGTLLLDDYQWRISMYTYINYCNIFLENIGNVYNMPNEEKALWAAEIKTLKAHIYYELMRRYGPIVLVDKNIPNNVSVGEMQQPRSSIDDCVKATIDLIDEALVDLVPRNQKNAGRLTYHSTESAYALKAKVLLLAASPQFNGNPAYAGFTNRNGENLFPTSYDPEKWRLAAEAADKAIEVCEANGMELIKGSTKWSTSLLNTMEDVSNTVLAPNYDNKEAVFMVRSNGHYDFWHALALPAIVEAKKPDQFHYMFMGAVSPSIKMVEMYYTENGLPIEMDKSWPYGERYRMGKEADQAYQNVVPINTEVSNLHLRREPRFYAHIAADQLYWQRGPKASDRLQVLPYRNALFGTTYSSIQTHYPQNPAGYYLKKGTYSDVTGEGYDVVFKREEGVVLIRLAELYLISAEAWNEYSGPTDKAIVPLNVIRERAGIPDVVTSWKNSNAPQQVDTKEGMRKIIRDEWNVEFAFEGQRFWNLRRWWIAHEELNEKQLGWNILGTDARQFYNNYEGPIVVWTERKFVSPRDYLFPMEAEQVMISGCKQNPGW